MAPIQHDLSAFLTVRWPQAGGSRNVQRTRTLRCRMSRQTEGRIEETPQGEPGTTIAVAAAPRRATPGQPPVRASVTTRGIQHSQKSPPAERGTARLRQKHNPDRQDRPAACTYKFQPRVHSRQKHTAPHHPPTLHKSSVSISPILLTSPVPGRTLSSRTAAINGPARPVIQDPS